MQAIEGYFLIRPEDHPWKVANPMKIPYADILERDSRRMTLALSAAEREYAA